MPKIGISRAEYERRIEVVRNELVEKELDALYLTNGVSIFYLTGYYYIVTERPAALIVPVDGEVTFIGPLLEIDHIPQRTRLIKKIETYLDYPGEKHPIDHFAEFLKQLRLHDKTIGIDNLTGASGRWGYIGPPITEKMPKTKFVEERKIIQKMRLLKSKEEIELIKESARWANLAHRFLQDYVAPGMWDVEISASASNDASVIMKKTLGHDYQSIKTGGLPVIAGFRGQVGSKSAIPHSLSTRNMIKKGDVLITGAGADYGGYDSELERTMVIGEPSEKQRKFFNVMLEAQDAALSAFKPGVKCSEVDKAASKVLRKAGYNKYVRHHTGHGLGIEGHEPPWLDIGDQTIMQPGMIFSCEPGIYIPGYAGFRHSDTVLITEDGKEVITYYPRDLDSLTIY